MSRVAEKSATHARFRELAGRSDVAIVAIVVLGLGLRLWGLASQSFWYDEWLTTQAASGGLWDAFRHAANREGIPPTYFVLMWGWVRAFGDSEIALRTVSAGFVTSSSQYASARLMSVPPPSCVPNSTSTGSSSRSVRSARSGPVI